MGMEGEVDLDEVVGGGEGVVASRSGEDDPLTHTLEHNLSFPGGVPGGIGVSVSVGGASIGG